MVILINTFKLTCDKLQFKNKGRNNQEFFWIVLGGREVVATINTKIVNTIEPMYRKSDRFLNTTFLNYCVY